MRKIVCIVGPTAVGKTALALNLAEKFNGALISADAVQVFKGLDIISGKDLPQDTQYTVHPEFIKNGYNTGFYNYRNIPIFLLDVVEPTSSFSVSQFQELANDAIDIITHDEKLPIVVGGTGLYVKSLLNPIETSRIEPDLELRKELEQLGVLDLQNRLKSINEQKLSSMNESDINNKRRLIRAIEISRIMNNESRIMEKKEYESLTIGLFCEREVLKKRIDERVETRLKEGALEEAKQLFKIYDNLTQQVKDANGYKQIFNFLNGEIILDEAIYRWKISEYRHAKNQMTWFRKYGNAEWFDIEEEGFEEKVENRLKNFLSHLL